MNLALDIELPGRTTIKNFAIRATAFNPARSRTDTSVDPDYLLGGLGSETWREYRNGSVHMVSLAVGSDDVYWLQLVVPGFRPVNLGAHWPGTPSIPFSVSSEAFLSERDDFSGSQPAASSPPAQVASAALKVLDSSSGSPLQHVQVLVTGPQGKLWSRLTTGQDGSYMLKTIPGVWDLEFRCPEYAPKTIHSVDITAKETLVAEVQLRKPSRVSGSLFLADGEEAPEGTVVSVSQGGFYDATTTDHGGRFELMTGAKPPFLLCFGVGQEHLVETLHGVGEITLFAKSARDLYVSVPNIPKKHRESSLTLFLSTLSNSSTQTGEELISRDGASRLYRFQVPAGDYLLDGIGELYAVESAAVSVEPTSFPTAIDVLAVRRPD